MTFHWPRKPPRATGTKLDEREEGDTRTGHWKTDKPASVAGFNLGEYAFASLADNGYSVDVYANRQLEQALLNRLRQPEMDDIASSLSSPIGAQRGDHLRLQMPPPSPADALKALARDIDSSILLRELFRAGTFPSVRAFLRFPELLVGLASLLYLSTYSFLPADTQQRGLSQTGQNISMTPVHFMK